jgi:hypothetical protein
MAADYESVAREHQALLDIRALALLRSRIAREHVLLHWHDSMRVKLRVIDMPRVA